MINLELYRIFYVVAETKNITKASEILNISQPAVTKHIKNLEDQLGNPLFIRTKKGVILNDGECKSANLKILSENDGIVTLTEGRYHQIKRMFGCYGAKVVELQRIGMGNFNLPDDLKLGECREFTEEELRKIHE